MTWLRQQQQSGLFCSVKWHRIRKIRSADGFFRLSWKHRTFWWVDVSITYSKSIISVRCGIECHVFCLVSRRVIRLITENVTAASKETKEPGKRQVVVSRSRMCNERCSYTYVYRETRTCDGHRRTSLYGPEKWVSWLGSLFLGSACNHRNSPSCGYCVWYRPLRNQNSKVMRHSTLHGTTVF